MKRVNDEEWEEKRALIEKKFADVLEDTWEVFEFDGDDDTEEYFYDVSQARAYLDKDKLTKACKIEGVHILEAYYDYLNNTVVVSCFEEHKEELINFINEML